MFMMMNVWNDTFSLILLSFLVFSWPFLRCRWLWSGTWWWRRRNEVANACAVGIYLFPPRTFNETSTTNHTYLPNDTQVYPTHETLIAYSTLYICDGNVVMNTWHEREWWPMKVRWHRFGPGTPIFIVAECWMMMNGDGTYTHRVHCYSFWAIFCPSTYI